MTANANNTSTNMESMSPSLPLPEELVGRFVESAAGAMDLYAMYVGEQLGLYRSLHERGPATSAVVDLFERLFYGFSIMVWLPDGMSHQPSAGTGTVMRPSTLDAYAREAGFARADVLPLEHDFFRFYELVLTA